ncbi:MAG: hypothetical protein WBE75_00195 [Candidatus Omnitrophota bacterium]|jgi:hypothetical protein
MRRQKRVFFLIGLCAVIMGPLSGNASSGKGRDPFIPLVTPEGRIIQPAVPYGEGDIRLEGLIYDENGSSLAIVNGAVARIGDTVRGYRVIKIEENKVVLMKDGELKEIPLQKKKEESFDRERKQ